MTFEICLEYFPNLQRTYPDTPCKTFIDEVDNVDYQNEASEVDNLDYQNEASEVDNLDYQNEASEVDNVDYQNEASRLESFKHWSISYMEPKKLAAAGFYFTGKDDIVCCFECHVNIHKWQENDDPMVEHKRLFPTCKFICGIACGNVPILRDSFTVQSLSSEGDDVCGLYDVKSDSDCDPFVSLLQTSKPKYPKYQDYESRIDTYRYWPKSRPQTKEQLAYAGFYYTGKEDQVLCYFCGVGVKDWEPNDDPWTEHAIWLPDCTYLLSVKGPNYVKRITEQDTESYVTKAGQQTIGAELKAGSTSGYVRNDIIKSNSSIKNTIENLDVIKTDDLKHNIIEARNCKICCSAEMSELFLPCSHLMACSKCATRMATCPLCRGVIADTIHVYFS